MMTRQVLRLTHVASTIWFMACIGYILVLSLHQAGFRWWIIFSVSGHSALVVFLLVSVYLFALFRGVGVSQQNEREHPLTTTSYYMGFYVAAPLLGGLAGLLGMIGTPYLANFLLGVAMGTLGTTFFVWVVVDPIAGLVESFLPASRRHRLERLAQAEAQRRTRQEKREQLLAEAFAREEQERQRWQKHLRPSAERLAALLTTDSAETPGAEGEAVNIGANAWRLGGLSCMRQLRDMVVSLQKDSTDRTITSERLSNWWDGIGDWRRPVFH